MVASSLGTFKTRFNTLLKKNTVGNKLTVKRRGLISSFPPPCFLECQPFCCSLLWCGISRSARSATAFLNAEISKVASANVQELFSDLSNFLFRFFSFNYNNHSPVNCAYPLIVNGRFNFLVEYSVEYSFWLNIWLKENSSFWKLIAYIQELLRKI